MEFEVNDMVFLKAAPWKGVIWFQKRGNLNPRYIGPFRIFERIGPVSYHLELPRDLERIHDIFHVCIIRKYISNPSHVLKTPLVELREDLSFEVQPVGILDHREKILRNEVVQKIKILWRSDRVEEMKWEIEASIRKRYPYFFFDWASKNFEDKISLNG